MSAFNQKMVGVTLTLKGLRCFFVMLRTMGGVILTLLPANSKPKEARAIKLCTVIANYIASINKQLKFLSSHCSIVCSYCSVVCLIAKMSQKLIEFLRFLK